MSANAWCFIWLKGDEAFVVIDAADAALIRQYEWRPSSNRRYAVTEIREAGRRVTISMHRLIMAAPEGSDVDHINGDGFDNRRENLRVCTRQQNSRNRRTHSNNKLGWKGVVKDGGQYRAVLMVGGRQKQVGRFACPVKAARAYDRAAAEHFGEFARLNFSPDRDWLFPHEYAGAWPPNN